MSQIFSWKLYILPKNSTDIKKSTILVSWWITIYGCYIFSTETEFFRDQQALPVTRVHEILPIELQQQPRKFPHVHVARSEPAPATSEGIPPLWGGLLVINVLCWNPGGLVIWWCCHSLIWLSRLEYSETLDSDTA